MGPGHILSEQACALTVDVQACFCVGAWLSVIVLAAAVVDASLRHEHPGYRGNTKDLIDAMGANEKLQSLRRRRNALVHASSENPAITIEQQWCDRDAHEAEAREAVALMFETLYMFPFV